ncbi:uncharacterized protein Asph isoform X2 [Eurosta solidaginis]|uniref:uncharacterized protein Asph isoform X2 n=1 Tax=Eurosta solidaginis TaxID=178769 RepID=UPI00353082F2
MSGDVQPRRRKDKKKKRDAFDRKSEGELSFSRHSSFEDDESSHGVHLTKMGSDDVHLHVQHDHGTGGHWCAKIFFFSLLAILFGLVGLIILENRGLADLDTPLSESRFSNYFDGWVDESRRNHGDHDPVQASIEEHSEEEDHSELDEDADEEREDHEGEDDEDDHDEDHNEDDEDENATEDEEDEDVDNEKAQNEDNDNDEDVTKEATLDQTYEEEDDDDENDDDDNNKEEADDADVTQEAITKEDDNDAHDNDDEDGDDDNNEGDEEEENISYEKTVEASEEINEVDDNAADDNEGDDNEEDDNEVDENVSNTDINGNDEDDNNDDNDSAEPIYERSTQRTTKYQQLHGSDDDDVDAFDEEDDDDDAFDSIENVVDNDAEELLLLQEKARQEAAEAAKNEPVSSQRDDFEETVEAVPSWASSLAVKIGVGVALALVARLVLIRNNPNTIIQMFKILYAYYILRRYEEPSPEAIMKRRLTIATEEDKYDGDKEEPPLPDDGEYSEEEIEIEEEYEYEEEVEDDDDKLIAMTGEYIPETFNQLNEFYRTRLQDQEAANQRIEVVRDQRPSAKQTPAVFNAPPPPLTSEMQSKKVPPYISTTTALKSPIQEPTITPATRITNTIKTTIAEPMKPTQNLPINTKQYKTDFTKVKKHEVTHDIDCHPKEENIDYDVNQDDDVDDDDNDGAYGAYGEELEEGEEEEEDDEDIDDDLLDEEEISDVDDTELMNRLEAKYGRLPAKEYESDEDPDDPTWTQIKPKENVAGGPIAHNDHLDSFERELRRANEEMMRENYKAAIRLFNQLAYQHPDQPRAFLGQAKALDELAERKRSNNLLEQALQAYKRYLALGDIITDSREFLDIANRCIDRMRFMGYHMQTVAIHELLIERFPHEPNMRNQLAITYLLQNRLSEAKLVLQDVLRRWPKDGLALVHYGFVLRQLDKDYEQAALYLRKGIETQAAGTHDGRFYLNLGDSLQRLGRQEEALKVHKRGAELQLFPSIYQRSLYNEPNLRAQPYWTKLETTYVYYLDKLEFHWQAIRDEALKLLSEDGHFLDEAESLRDTGNWQQFELYARGQRVIKNCEKAPFTCELIEKFGAAAGCRRGQVKFSVMQPGTHVHAHCGPTNCRLRAHLGLVVPPGPRLRVANEERFWSEGKFLIFDDSFEHEVWHNGTSFRLVLIVDVWHPDLSAHQRRTLAAI